MKEPSQKYNPKARAKNHPKPMSIEMRAISEWQEAWNAMNLPDRLKLRADFAKTYLFWKADLYDQDGFNADDVDGALSEADRFIAHLRE